MNQIFRFAIMGAGHIASKFCEAVELTEQAKVVAISSKSMERADTFAKEHNLSSAYDNYETMLKEEKIDCVYIAVTTNAHYELSMLCLDYKVPVLCEKAMFTNSKDADTVFRRSKELGVFVMEAMWSRFLPSIRKAKSWIAEKRIGTTELAQMNIGFCAPKDMNNRFYNPKLGGGAAFDLTVYTYEIMTYLIEEELKNTRVDVIFADNGVDVTDGVTLRFEHTMAYLLNSFAANLEEKAVIYGDSGKIEILRPHVGGKVSMYSSDGSLMEEYEDKETTNGFTYEIKEVMDCICAGKIESSVVPHSLTLQCAVLFDQIYACNSEK